MLRQLLSKRSVILAGLDEKEKQIDSLLEKEFIYSGVLCVVYDYDFKDDKVYIISVNGDSIGYNSKDKKCISFKEISDYLI